MALLRGDFGALDVLMRKMRAMAYGPVLKEELVHRLAATAIKLMADEFRQSHDPYGTAWKPVFRNRKKDKAARKRRYLRQSKAGKAIATRADKPLIDSGRLRAAATASTADSSSGSTVRVTIPVEYASYHQDGTRHIARRQIVPDAAGGLGPIWEEAFRKTIEDKLVESMGGR
jgi:phage gpG-like protein